MKYLTIYPTQADRPATTNELLTDLLKIDKPLKKLINLQKKLPSINDYYSNKTLIERFNDFKAWLPTDTLINKNYDFDLSVTEGIGVIATRNIKKDEIIMKIPRNIIITEDDVYNDKEIGAILRQDKLCQSMPSLSLAIYLLKERYKGNSSSISSYLNVLAKQHEIQMPFTYDYQILQKLTGSSTYYDCLYLKNLL